MTDTPTTPPRYIPPPDLVLAWSNAANCRLYEDDPGPSHYRDGSATEGRMLTRVDAWRDFYARSLLHDLGADPDRLTAGLDAVNSRIRRSHRPGFWVAIAWRRLRAPGGRRARSVLSVLDRSERAADRAVWECAAELSTRALALVRDAGAETDAVQRQRLIAGTAHYLRMGTFGAHIPEVAADSETRLLEFLASTDQHTD